MLRSFAFLLLLLVIFLTGMLIGIDREKTTHGEGVQTIVESYEFDTASANKGTDDEQVTLDNPEHFTQKTASFLEAGVKGFYEIVVEVLYQISLLFI